MGGRLTRAELTPAANGRPDPFSDDDLEKFYRAVEAATEAADDLRRGPRRASPEHRGCPTPNKDGYRTRAEAEEAIARSRLLRRDAAKLRTYRCECGLWHITSSPDLGPRIPKPPRRPRRGGRR